MKEVLLPLAVGVEILGHLYWLDPAGGTAKVWSGNQRFQEKYPHNFADEI